MNQPEIYMDYAATTPTHPEVAEAMVPYFTKVYGNPASLHHSGKMAHQAIQEATDQIAAHLNIPSTASIYFTSGGTEASNTALKGIAYGLQEKGKHLITSQIEHPATLETCFWLESQGWKIDYLPVDQEGYIGLDALKEAIRPDTVLISIIHANNEVGTIQDLQAIGNLAKQHSVLLHIDAVQSIGKIPMDFSQLPIDMASCSAHKFYGPKGVGFLYLSEDAKTHITPLLHGGGQQQGMRSGTENTPGVIGMAKALDMAITDMPQITPQLRALQDRLTTGIREIASQARLNGPANLSQRIPGIVNVSFPPIEGETLVLRFDLEGIAVSSGSACHSTELKGSHVLKAMGASDAEARSSVRFSLGRHTSAKDIEAVLISLPRILQRAGYFRNTTSTVTIQ